MSRLQKYVKEEMEIISWRGKEYEFSDMRIDRDTIPNGKYLYEIADGDSDGEPARIRPSILVNFFGTLISDEPLDFGDDDVIWITEEDDFCYL